LTDERNAVTLQGELTALDHFQQGTILGEGAQSAD
jgi:hypothetical protein